MVIQGHDGTIPVSMEDALYHTRIVRRGAPNTFVVGDMPFLSHRGLKGRGDPKCRCADEKAGADCVKMEGDMWMVATAAAIVNARCCR